MSQLEHEMEEILHDWDSLEIEADDKNSRYEAVYVQERTKVDALDAVERLGAVEAAAGLWELDLRPQLPDVDENVEFDRTRGRLTEDTSERKEV